jgi:beta-mannanase
VESFRTASDDFLFAWDYAPGYGDPTAFYPGDDYVDVVAQDFYWNPQWIGNDPVEAFDTLRDMPYGLQWMEEFADAHGKQTAYPEWGVRTDNAGPFIERAEEWFESHDVVQATYWDHDSAYPGMLSDSSEPNSGAAFVEVFG